MNFMLSPDTGEQLKTKVPIVLAVGDMDTWQTAEGNWYSKFHANCTLDTCGASKPDGRYYDLFTG